ncbi:uncharacterized protein LOC114259494 [Camellia sinensis]|uniref:uncharacterized protein LOC114259494 n=1 Tax=Camellia sinensis TaxID=4442 RepID=UPI0010366725|nr:uncharacterized protein LOC114259494 [Camellia sinensis]
MVVTQGPGRSSPPRPRIYIDILFNDERVVSLSPITDPLMAWAESMGELGSKCLRLQGHIEGNQDSSPSPPLAPMATKRQRQFMVVIEEKDDLEDGVKKRRTPARKLEDDFYRVTTESGWGRVREGSRSSVKSV